MKKKQEIMNELDQAIDAMDADGIDCGLEALASIETHPIQAENVKLFTARIKKLNKENVEIMKPHKIMKVAIIAAAIMIVGATVYAANSFQIFSFIQDNRYVTVRTNGTLTDAEGNPVEMKIELNPSADVQEHEEPDYQSFDSVEHVEEELDMKLVIPFAAAQMQLESAVGEKSELEGSDRRYARITYSDITNSKLDIITSRLISSNSDILIISEYAFEEGSLSTYKNKYGVDFTLYTQDGKQTYAASIGEYEYSITFTSYDEKEQKEIIDTIDLSEYQ